MYVGLYAICVWNWNWRLTQHHFLMKHWSQRTHRCSAPVLGLEEYSLRTGQPLQHGEVRYSDADSLRKYLSTSHYGVHVGKFSWQWYMKIVIIMFLNLGDVCQSIWNGNTTKAMIMLLLWVDVLKMMMIIIIMIMMMIMIIIMMLTMIDGDGNEGNNEDWRRRWWWSSNVAMEHAFISLILVIDRKDFEQAYPVGHKKKRVS